MTITLDDVRAALALSDFDYNAAHALMSPDPRGSFVEMENAKQAGVLALLYPAGGSLHLVLTRRTTTLRGHSGQISFPGGRRDPEDESFTATALRETCEELGVCADITPLGTLSPIYIPPSNFMVFPTVGYLPYAPTYTPNPDEVAEVIAVTLEALLDGQYKREEYRTFQNTNVRVPYYELQGHKVWGATAIMLSEFEQRLHTALSRQGLR